MSRRRNRMNAITKPQERPRQSIPTCRICLRQGPLTDEDMFPIWARQVAREVFPLPPGKQLPPRIKTRICGSCNSRLSRVFENNAAPLLRPMARNEELAVSPRGQVVISGWVAKTSLLISFHNLKAHEPGYQEIRRALLDLMDSALPPPQTSVRLMRIDPTDVHRQLPTSEFVGHQGLPRPHGLFGMMTLGHVGWEVCIGGGNDLIEFIAHTAEGEWYQRFWPPPLPRRELLWPPPQVVSWPDYTRLRDAWMTSRPPGEFERVWHRRWQRDSD